MGCFICAKCGCVDNTATSEYCKIEFDETGNHARYVPGKWHGRFPKEKATEDQKRRVGKDGLIHHK